MANFHLYSEPFIKQLPDNRSIVLEIGSERGEGSTAWFDSISKKLNKEFFSGTNLYRTIADEWRRNIYTNTRWKLYF